MIAGREAQLQSQIIKWLKSQGAFVVKLKPQPGVPVGAPDILFLYEGAWAVIEVKASKSSPFRPGQLMTLDRLRQWSHLVYVAYPENWDVIRNELVALFF